MRLLISTFLVLLLTGATFMAGQVRLSAFEIRAVGSDFQVSWTTEVEDEVRQFEIMRRSPNSNDQFVRVHSSSAHGIGQEYGFIDTQVFKSGSDKLDYRLDAVYFNGVREAVRTESVNYTSTAVRRTWGSLKAMFQ
ncbi:MAG: hypothetical protein ACPG3U_10575 [Rhodothermales bacterium]|jgi:hypothetical protein